MRLSLFSCIILTGILSLGVSQPCAAGKLDLMMGGFNIVAQSGNRKGTIQNLGAYQLSYKLGLLSNFEFSFGYTFIVSKIYTGDIGFGPDLGFFWFPFTQNAPTRVSTANSTFALTEMWRPYVGLGFAQRQFQVVQSGYAGFGAMIGVERSIQNNLSLKAEARYQQLSGSATSSATEMDALFGISVLF